MRYYSTRSVKHDPAAAKSFYEAIFSGFASDGGLFVPEEIPKLNLQQILEWKNFSYWQIAAEICTLYCDSVDKAQITEICKRAAETFEIDSTLKLSPLTETVQILELFHGATGAFKDLSMSAFAGFLELYTRTAQKPTSLNERAAATTQIVALVNTTGDTGPAALAAFAAVDDGRASQTMSEKENFRSSIVCMYPRGWCAGLQQVQMHKAGGKNGYVWEYDGSPDTMDRVIAKLFVDEQFRAKHPNLQLLSLNSLNWFRVMYQIVHYFWTFLQLYDESESTRIQCCVPTSASGAGHITGGVLAKLMGLPIDLIAVVNENDILYRMLNSESDDSTPIQVPSPAKTTLATAMDGVFPYNFERLLYFATNGDELTCQKVVQAAIEQNQVTLDEKVREKFKKILRVERITNQEIGATMRQVHEEFGGKFICPHTACAVCAAVRDEQDDIGGKKRKVCFATARAEKFTEAVEKVGLKPDDAFENYLKLWQAKTTQANMVDRELSGNQSKIAEDWTENAVEQLKAVVESCLTSK